MTGEQHRKSSGLDRAKRWLANARVTAAVTANVVNPAAGPVADRFNGGPPRSNADVAQEIQEDGQKDWARYELLRRERAAGETPERPVRPARQPQRGR